MEVYVFMFLISSLSCFIAEKAFNNKNKKIGTLFSMIAILIPAVVAGFRDFSIGTDVNVYGNYMFQLARNNTFLGYFSMVGYGDFFYTILTFLCAKLFGNLHFLLFFIQLINCFFIYKAIYSKRGTVPIWLAYLLFLFTLYFRQLNLLRQGIAISLIIYSFTFLENKKNKHYFIITSIACLFHSSALVSFIIFFIYKYLNDKSKKTNKKLFAILLICMVLVFSFFFINIVDFVTRLGMFGSKYSYSYFERYIDGAGIDWFGCIFKLIILIILTTISIKGKMKNKIKDFDFYYYLCLLDFVFWNMSYYILYMNRISFYFGYIYLLFFLPLIKKILKNNIFNKILLYSILILSFYFYWYFKYIIQNAGNVYPYIVGL